MGVRRLGEAQPIPLPANNGLLEAGHATPLGSPARAELGPRRRSEWRNPNSQHLAIGAVDHEGEAERQGGDQKRAHRGGDPLLPAPLGLLLRLLLPRCQHSEKALVAALMEMYVQGVSTRRVKAITEELCGHEFSASAVSDINQKLDEELTRFMTGRLEEEYPYLILDG